jgi:hypothetical protein
MATTDVSHAAQVASEQSGIPASVLAALITLEGPTQSAPNNPFDIVQEWANLAGQEAGTNWGSFVTGLWNSVGVAVFSNELAAIQAWAYGLLHFSNYAGVRATLANPNATVQDFYDALGATGYAGGSTTFTGSLGTIYASQTGQDPTLDIATPFGPISLPDPFYKPTQALGGLGAGIATAVNTFVHALWILVGLVLIGFGLWILTRENAQ